MSIFISIIISSTSFANPFLKKEDDKVSSNPRMDIKQNIEQLEKELRGNSPRQTPEQTTPTKDMKAWDIVGKINNKILITDGKNERMVGDGESIGDCIVNYPEILCGEKKDEAFKNFVESTEKLKKDNDRLEKQASEMQTQIESLRKEIESVKSEFNASSDKIKELNRLLADADTKIQQNQKKNENIIMKKDSEIVMLKTDMEKLNNEKDGLLSQIETLKKEISSKSSDCKKAYIQHVGNVLMCDYGDMVAIRVGSDKLQAMEALLMDRTYKKGMLRDDIIFILNRRDVIIE
jgi:predicted RNase H-like nuclease (RuvC/YqgF family)